MERTGPLSANSLDGNSPPALQDRQPRQSSPALSVASSGLSSVSASSAPGNLVASNHASSAKRRKLNPLERLQKEQDKAERKAQKDVEKSKREAEKQVRDEERRKLNEIKEMKRHDKELEKQQKEEIKRRKEEEMAKKDRSQSRIFSFMKAHIASTNARVTPALLNPETDHAQIAQEPAKHKAKSETPRPQSCVRSDYELTFLPFNLSSHTSLAPTSRFSWDQEAIDHLQQKIQDGFGMPPECHSPTSLVDAMQLLPSEMMPRGVRQPCIKEIISTFAASSANLIDLTQPAPVKCKSSLQALHGVTMRYIYFDQDVRPPYVGTHTKPELITNTAQLSRTPCKRILPHLNYDYDSEAEWEEPEEGEDLDSECESETDSDGGEEMEGFVEADDVNGLRLKTGYVPREVEPTCSGICWEDANGTFAPWFEDYRIELVRDLQSFPIDPYAVASDVGCGGLPLLDEASLKPPSMDPPRIPLMARPNTVTYSTVETPNVTECTKVKSRQARKTPTGLLTGEDLEEFKNHVRDSDLTKTGLLAVLKKRFPKVTNTVIAETLSAVAERVGKKEADKRWTIIEQT